MLQIVYILDTMPIKGGGRKSMSIRRRSKKLRIVQFNKPFGARDPGFVDLASASRALDTTGVIVLVATIAQGATINDRLGKKAMYKSFQIRGRVVANSATVTALGAIMLVYDKRPTGSLPAITDVLETINAASLTNNDNSNRFQIIYRRQYNIVGNTTGVTTDSVQHSIDDFVKFKGTIGFKSAGTGAIADIEHGAVYLITCGNVAAGTTAADSAITIRTRFEDV